MEFFDDYEEEQPRRRKKRGIGDSDNLDNDRLDWQDMIPGEEPEEEPIEEEDDEMQELEIDERGRIKHGGAALDPDFWNEEE